MVLNKKGKLLIIIILLFNFLIIYNIFKDKNETHIIENKKNYNLKIDYPYIKNKKIRKETLKYIENSEKEFKNNIKNNEYPIDLNLIINQEKYNNINYVSINKSEYLGGNHYEEEKISYVYDDKCNKKNINDFLNEDGFKKISLLSYYKIMKLNDDDHVFDDEWVKNGTKDIIENYKHFKFNSEGLSIIFEPLQVGAYSNGYVNILLTYDEINKYLKEEYRNYKNDNIVINKPLKRNLEQFKNKKLIAFTYDDGPSNNTNFLLDNLSSDAKVTFFVLGSRVNNYKDTIKRAYESGHTIANHSYSHRNFNLLHDNEILDEVIKTNDNIKNIIGEDVKYLRPPYGNLKDNELIDMGLILWDIDTLDWKYKDKNKVCDTILKNAHDGAIVLTHDLYKSSIEGTLLAMKELEKEGYAFVTIDEMFELKSINIEKGKKYYNIKQ